MKFSLSRFLPHLPGKALRGFCPSAIGRFLFLGSATEVEAGFVATLNYGRNFFCHSVGITLISVVSAYCERDASSCSFRSATTLAYLGFEY